MRKRVERPNEDEISISLLSVMRLSNNTRTGSFGARVGSQHLAEKLVRHTSFDELLFRQNTVVILVHLGKYLLRSFFGRVARVDVRQRRSYHVVDRLHRQTTAQQSK